MEMILAAAAACLAAAALGAVGVTAVLLFAAVRFLSETPERRGEEAPRRTGRFGAGGGRASGEGFPPSPDDRARAEEAIQTGFENLMRYTASMGEEDRGE